MWNTKMRRKFPMHSLSVWRMSDLLSKGSQLLSFLLFPQCMIPVDNSDCGSESARTLPSTSIAIQQKAVPRALHLWHMPHTQCWCFLPLRFVWLQRVSLLLPTSKFPKNAKRLMTSISLKVVKVYFWSSTRLTTHSHCECHTRIFWRQIQFHTLVGVTGAMFAFVRNWVLPTNVLCVGMMNVQPAANKLEFSWVLCIIRCIH